MRDRTFMARWEAKVCLSLCQLTGRNPAFLQHRFKAASARRWMWRATTEFRQFLYDKRLKGEWTADTFLYYHKGLKSFFDWCVGNGYLPENPIARIEKPKLDKKLPKRISSQDAQRIMEHAFHGKAAYRFERYRNRALIAVMLYTGLRATEILNLKIGHVDMTNRCLHCRWFLCRF